MGLFLLALAPAAALVVAVAGVAAFLAGAVWAGVPLLLVAGWVAAFSAIRRALLEGRGLA